MPAIPRVPGGPPPPELTAPPWPPSGPLTIEQAVDLGLVRSPLLRGAIAEVEAQVARAWQAATGYRPQVRLEYVATRYQQPLGVPFTTTLFGQSQTIQAAPFTISQFEDRLSIRQVVLDGGRVRALVQQNLAAARAAYARLLRAVQEFRFQVRQAYVAVLEAEAFVRVAEEALRSTREHLALTEASFKAGVSARADITFARTPVARSETEVVSARNAVRLARARLNRLMGSDPALVVPITGEADLPTPETSLEQTRLMAQEARPDLVARREEVRSWQYAAEVAKKERSVNVQAIAAGRQVGYTEKEIVPRHPGWSVSLEVSYPLWDGGLSRYQEIEANARARASEAAVEDLARDVDVEVVDAWVRLESARERLQVDEAQVADAREALAVARGQYTAGVAPILNVLDAEVSLVRAEADQVRARFDLQRALARLHLAMGQ